MSLRAILVVTVASLAAAPLAFAAPPGPALPTAQFVKAAAQSDEFERQEGALAEQRAADPRVKDFARRMVADHTKTTQALDAAIGKAGLQVPPPAPLTAAQQQDIAALKGLQGSAFDLAYMSQQVRAHEHALGLMQDYSAHGDNPVLRQAAGETAPIIEHHLELARMLPGGGG